MAKLEAAAFNSDEKIGLLHCAGADSYCDLRSHVLFNEAFVADRRDHRALCNIIPSSASVYIYVYLHIHAPSALKWYHPGIKILISQKLQAIIEKRFPAAISRLQVKDNRRRPKTAFQNAGFFVVHLAL